MASLAQKVFPFLAWRHRVTAATLRADAIAGLVGALVVLPQGVAYATLAGLPPQYGLYCAIVPALVAALWGSSWHQVSGPTNAMALVVFATLSALAAPGSDKYVELALTLSLLIGILQLALGIARLGTLVNFISHTVIVGFTAGAGVLIIAAQLRNFTGVPVPADAHFFNLVSAFARHVSAIDPWILATGGVTLVTAIAAKQVLSRFPYMIVGMLAGSAFAYVLGRAGFATIPTVGALPATLPPLSAPSFDLDVWRQLAPTAIALTLLGLTQAISIARAIAVKAGQRIDGNQEFVGQGLSNIAGAFTSSMPSSGSVNRCGVNYEAGAKTPLAAVFSALLLAVILLVIAPLATFLPLAVMAALLFIVAWGLIDFAEIRRISRTNRSDLLALVVTFVATLTVQLEFAIFVGVLASLLVYLNRTTHPSLTRVAPDSRTPQRRFEAMGESSRVCPQLDILRLDGSLFFGAVEHVRDELEAARRERPDATHVLLVASGVNFIDTAGCESLVQASRHLRDTGATLYLCNLKPGVHAALERGGFLADIGADRVWPTKADAIRALYKRFRRRRVRGLHRAHLHRMPHLPAQRHAADRERNRAMSVQADLGSAWDALGLDPSTLRGEGAVARSPIDGSALGAVPLTTAAALDDAIARAAAAQRAWASVPAPARGEVVRRYGNALREHKDALGRLVTLETGKLLQEGLGEVQEMIDVCDFAVGLSRQLHGLTMASERPDHRMLETWHPFGVCGVVSAFNFPVAVWTWNAALAFVCGNAVIWKPSEKAPLSAWAAHELLRRTLREASPASVDVAHLAVGDRALGEALVGHPAVRLVSATGSTAMGRAVGEACARTFKRTILELGGNNAAIVCPSADEDLAMRAIVFAAVGTAGQRCTTLRRLFVHESRYRTFVDRLAGVYASIRIGDPREAGTLVGPLVDRAAFDAMQRALVDASAEGGRVIGGERVLADAHAQAWYARPAIVEMPSQSPTMLRETFAPILYAMPYRSLDEAVALNNAAAHGLSSSIFTRDLTESETFLSSRGSDCGITNVNIGTSGAEIGGAFGGEKDTGGGRESGSDAWRAYMRRATSTINYGSTLPLAQGISFDV